MLQTTRRWVRFPPLPWRVAADDDPLGVGLENRRILGRWIGVLLVGPLLGLASQHHEQPEAVSAVLAVVAGYNLVISWVTYYRPGWLAQGRLTALGDCLLAIFLIKAAGGLSGPFYFLLFPVAVSAAMRHGYVPSLTAVAVIVSVDLQEGLADQGSVGAAFFIRSGFLAISTALAAYLRGQALGAAAALSERLRQVRLLNEVSRALAGSLQLETTAQSIVDEARRLFEGDYATLRLVKPAVDRVFESTAARPVAQESVASVRLTLVGPEAPGGEHGARPPHWEPMERGLVALKLPLSRHGELVGTLAICRQGKHQTVPGAVNSHLVLSFTDIATVAIEKAELYGTLAERTHEVQRAYRELASAHQELQTIDDLKTNFLANVSHELRTPLTSIQACSELLLTYPLDRDTRLEFLGIISSESERLTRLVNDALDVTRIEGGEMEWQMSAVDLREVLHSSVSSAQAVAVAKGLKLESAITEELPAVWGDRDRLYQVVSNLLNNALKFTSQGIIRVSVGFDGSQVRVSVSDTGMGIRPEDQQRIFTMFHQAGDALTEKPSGTGLGLSICKDIVVHHGGKIWVESTPGVGSSFIFTLPPFVEGKEREMS